MIKQLVLAIRIYQAVSLGGLIPPACRFYPTCSNYAVEALEKRGVFSGLITALRRLIRCHPGHPGGWDPVEKESCNSL